MLYLEWIMLQIDFEVASRKARFRYVFGPYGRQFGSQNALENGCSEVHILIILNNKKSYATKYCVYYQYWMIGGATDQLIWHD